MTEDLKIKHLVDYADQTRHNLMIRGSEPELKLNRFPEVSNITNGLPKGQMILIGARPSNGKSTVAMNFAYDLAEQGKKVLFISLEMTIPRIMERMFCMEYKIHNYKLKEGAFAAAKEYRDNYEEFCDQIAKFHFVASDMIGKSPQDIDNFLMKNKNKPDVVFIDHIQEISGTDKKKAMEEYISRLRTMCIRDNFSLVLCSQINRLGQNEEVKTPQLHHLKGTGFLEEATDIALLLHWPYHYDRTKNKEYFEINVAKNRDGEPGYLKLKFLPHNYRLESWEGGSQEPKDWDDP